MGGLKLVEAKHVMSWDDSEHGDLFVYDNEIWSINKDISIYYGCGETKEKVKAFCITGKRRFICNGWGNICERFVPLRKGDLIEVS